MSTHGRFVPGINYSISVADTTKRPSHQVAGMEKTEARTWLKSGTVSSVRLEWAMTVFMRHAVLSNVAVNWLSNSALLTARVIGHVAQTVPDSAQRHG